YLQGRARGAADQRLADVGAALEAAEGGRAMMYWVREIAGWLLVLLGLLLFLTVYDFCERRGIFEAGILTVVGVFVFLIGCKFDRLEQCEAVGVGMAWRRTDRDLQHHAATREDLLRRGGRQDSVPVRRGRLRSESSRLKTLP